MVGGGGGKRGPRVLHAGPGGPGSRPERGPLPGIEHTGMPYVDREAPPVQVGVRAPDPERARAA